MAKRAIVPITAVLLSMIGFASGLHTQALLQGDTLKTATGCFPFGLWQVMEGKPYGICCLFAFLSAAFYACTLLAGTLSWISFPLVPLTLSGLGFKLGVAFAFLSRYGFASVVWLCTFFLAALFCACALACTVFDRRLYHVRRKADYSDRTFLFRVLIGCVCFSLFACLMLIPAVFLPLDFYSVFDTLL